MAAILLLYSTTDGQTLRICERLRQHLTSMGGAVTLASIDSPPPGRLDTFDAVVIGARIRYGKHHSDVFRFINDHLAMLRAVPSAFFSVNIVARKPEKNRPETNPYVRKFLQRTAWKPLLVDVFAGKLDYPRYGMIDRMMIQLIMRITRGPTDPATVVEFTDWSRVEAFACAVAALAGLPTRMAASQ